MDINYNSNLKKKNYEKNVDYIKNNIKKGLKIMSQTTNSEPTKVTQVGNMPIINY